MSDSDLDFDPEELAMLRQLFRTEAHDALEAVTARVLATGSAKPATETLTEMMRVTHTLKGAAGTVGLDVMVELAHRLESAFALLGLASTPWTAATADLVVEVTDGLRGYLDMLAVDTAAAETLATRLRELIDRIATDEPAAREPRDSGTFLVERPSVTDISPNDSLSMPTITEMAAPEGM